MKKTTSTVLACTALLMLTAGCKKKEPPMVEPPKPLLNVKKVEKSTEPSTNGLGISDAKFEEIIKKSLKSKGNNYLVKQVLDKLKNGNEEVIVSTIGGSVTEGAGPSSYTQGYAYQFKDMLTKEFAKDPSKVKFIPAGIGGTPSPMGLIRYEKDVVIPGGRNPDLLVIEFAVNDWLECSNTRSIEYMIRNAIENNTAVIMLYAAATYANQQPGISPVAMYYNVPEVSISDGLLNSGINQEKDSKIYYSDYVHPTQNGHKYMAKCLINLLKEIDTDAADSKPVLPETYKNEKPFTNFQTVYGNTNDSNVKISAGSFDKKDEAIQGYMHGGKCFPENWYNDGTGTESFKMNLTCKSLILISKNSNSDTFGKAEVYVDGKLVNTFDGHDGSGWNNCMINMVIDEEKSAPHTVEIKNENGKAFTILAFGYSK